MQDCFFDDNIDGCNYDICRGCHDDSCHLFGFHNLGINLLKTISLMAGSLLLACSQFSFPFPLLFVNLLESLDIFPLIVSENSLKGRISSHLHDHRWSGCKFLYKSFVRER